MCVCIYIYIYTYVYTDIDIDRYAKRERERARASERDTEHQADIYPSPSRGAGLSIGECPWSEAPGGMLRAPQVMSCDIPSRTFLPLTSCDIHAHTPARRGSANFQLYNVVLQTCSANCLGHGHGYECRSPGGLRRGGRGRGDRTLLRFATGSRMHM